MALDGLVAEEDGKEACEPLVAWMMDKKCYQKHWLWQVEWEQQEWERSQRGRNSLRMHDSYHRRDHAWVTSAWEDEGREACEPSKMTALQSPGTKTSYEGEPRMQFSGLQRKVTIGATEEISIATSESHIILRSVANTPVPQIAVAETNGLALRMTAFEEQVNF